MKFRGLLAPLVATMVAAIARPSEACTLAQRPIAYRPMGVSSVVLQVPSNTTLFQRFCTSNPPPTQRDDALSTTLGRDVFRFTSEPAVGVEFPANLFCGGPSMRIAATTDRTAPSPVVIDRVRTLRVRNPASGAVLNCPELDMLEIWINTRDEQAADAQLGILAFVGATADEVRNLSVASLVLAPSDRSVASPGMTPSNNVTHVVQAWLGRDGTRPGSNVFDRAGTFCFSLAAMDLAGNIGTRSEPRCVDTTNAMDPTVEFRQGAGCSVRAPGARSPWFLGTSVLALLGVALLRRRNSQART